MHNHRFQTALVCSAILASVSPARAWDSKGHMMVAYIAYQQLVPSVRDRVDQLLALNPLHDQWLSIMPSDVSDLEKRRDVFVLAATWPDLIRSDPAYSDDGTRGGNLPDGASSSQNTGYGDKLRHRYWHFVNTPFSNDGTSLPFIPTPNAQERIHVFRTVIASSTATDAVKSYDLVWLLHLIGDVHQPLHAATRVSAGQPEGDRGGNLVSLCSAPCRDELHGFWDDILGVEQTVGAAEGLAATLPAAPSADANTLDEAIWVKDSFSLAKASVYQSPIGAGAGPFTITPAYQASAKTLATKQIALAGARLGNVLNAELK